MVSPNTLRHYDSNLKPFLAWTAASGVHAFGELDVSAMRAYRLHVATRERRHGGRLRPHTVRGSHSALATFMRWADGEGYEVDLRILDLPGTRLPELEAEGFHMEQLLAILEACNPGAPHEALAVRILVGSGLRASELCGLALTAPDGRSDVLMDRLPGGAELRVRWDAGAKGRKSRRVPVTPGLDGAIRRYRDRDRPAVAHGELLINGRGEPFRRYGVDAMMDRLQRRVGFRVHAHAFRHTFATVATKLGWSFEHLRTAMGHADYKELQRYVKLATTRDLGARSDWVQFVVADPTLDWT
jgi:integrase